MSSDSPFLEAYCQEKPGATVSCPFGEEHLVFKLEGKIFAILTVDGAKPRISLKCDPEMAGDLRRDFPAVKPGYHLNKQHWNSVDLDESVPESVLLGMIDHSYGLIFKSLPKARREKI
ncbi:MAG TPA: MmcQ-like protein [Cyanobacteria bacterium UBA8530]|nr:MmcQ-like protein [Cyanobacteria bacterium UBA8530]